MHIAVKYCAKITAENSILSVPPRVHCSMNEKEVSNAPVEHRDRPENEVRSVFVKEDATNLKHSVVRPSKERICFTPRDSCLLWPRTKHWALEMSTCPPVHQ